VRVVILAKISQLSLQVTRIPENRLIKEFSTNGPDQPFNASIASAWVLIVRYPGRS
jgi:hypothetical protein